MNFASRMIVSLAVACVMSASLTAVASRDTGAYFSDSVTGTFSGSVSGATCSVTASVVETGGVVSPASQAVDPGGTATVTVTPAVGYHITSITDNGRSVTAASSVVLANVTVDHALSVTFAINTYAITVTQGANGTISPGTTMVDHGSSRTFTVTPACGYKVVSVTVDGVNKGVLASYTFTNVTAAHSITAVFTPVCVKTWTITASAGCNGSVSPKTQTVQSGCNATVTITPLTGYRIATLVVDCVSVVPTGAVVFSAVNANHTVAATFAAKTSTVSFNSNGGSKVAAITRACGSPLNEPTAPTRCGFAFGGWYSDPGLTRPFVFGVMPESDVTLYAKWLAMFTVTVHQGSNGSISPGTTTLAGGASVTFDIKAKAGCHIVSVTVDGHSVGAVVSYTFADVKADHVITATFAKKTCAIAPASAPHASSSPSTTIGP